MVALKFIMEVWLIVKTFPQFREVFHFFLKSILDCKSYLIKR